MAKAFATVAASVAIVLLVQLTVLGIACVFAVVASAVKSASSLVKSKSNPKLVTGFGNFVVADDL